MLIALLSSTCKSGNSDMARGLAEYTEAPASDTMIYSTFLSLYSFTTSDTSFSLSREAVPLPTAMISTLYFLIKSLIIFLASSHLFCGSCG